MSTNDWLGDDKPKSKSHRKPKGKPHVLDEPIDDTFDSMLDNASKSANFSASLKQKSARKSTTEAASGWSRDIAGDDDSRDNTNAPPVVRRRSRRAAEEIIATDIPTIPMDEADADDTIGMTPQIAVAPIFSVNQIASFTEMEEEFFRERTTKYIDPKIDIGILYYTLRLQEDFDAEDKKTWDWDKTFVEVRNSITNLTTES